MHVSKSKAQAGGVGIVAAILVGLGVYHWAPKTGEQARHIGVITRAWTDEDEQKDSDGNVTGYNYTCRVRARDKESDQTYSDSWPGHCGFGLQGRDVTIFIQPRGLWGMGWDVTWLELR